MIGFDSAAERRGFWRGVMFGLTLAGVVALLMAPPKAHAEPFATVSAGKVIVTLRTDQGPCVGDARLATWQRADADDHTIPGCWVLGGDRVLISWLDGDRGNIAVARLVKVRGS